MGPRARQGAPSAAVVLLAGLGFHVAASTGAPSRSTTCEIMVPPRSPARIDGDSCKSLQSERWAGVVDILGSHTLANACAATRCNGAIAACGLT